ncbi:hypothetical protein NQ176_g1911 [Zarea fungicola]|uniref:Uncharacterized protein n=1 Tax=Zarea fungicola TaxID=93591 RepID=A0ACC1NQR7_9HYPO|nr:hypothetical protein NQ176_g1911 [Lecanicillium fungicola]
MADSETSSSFTVPFWLDGKEIIASDTFDVITPIRQEKIYECSSASENDVLAALQSAQKAFELWSQTKPATRRNIFLRAAGEFERRLYELAMIAHNETGSPITFCQGQVKAMQEACTSLAGQIHGACSSTAPITAHDGQSAMVMKQAYGVVLGITPWNAPYPLGARACLQPLAMGNTVVLKGPEAAPKTSWAISSVLHAAGLPAGCLNTLYHRSSDAAQITKLLVSNPTVKKINFTGSTAVGSIIASLAGEYLKPTVMELGGKAVAIVCEDADIKSAAGQCALGAFLNAGQICMSTEKIVVHARIADAFRTALKQAMDRLFGSNAMGMPQLISKAPVEKNKRLVADAVAKGATVFYGDFNADLPSQTTMQPVILENVKPDMDIYKTESFGPTVALYVVQTDEEAVRMVNESDYGLSSAVFTEDLRRAMNLAKQIEAGAVHINSMTVHDDPALPHGGLKNSGYGRFNGPEGLQEWVWSKVVTWKD